MLPRERTRLGVKRSGVQISPARLDSPGGHRLRRQRPRGGNTQRQKSSPDLPLESQVFMDGLASVGVVPLADVSPAPPPALMAIPQSERDVRLVRSEVVRWQERCVRWTAVLNGLLLFGGLAALASRPDHAMFVGVRSGVSTTATTRPDAHITAAAPPSSDAAVSPLTSKQLPPTEPPWSPAAFVVTAPLVAGPTAGAADTSSDVPSDSPVIAPNENDTESQTTAPPPASRTHYRDGICAVRLADEAPVAGAENTAHIGPGSTASPYARFVLYVANAETRVIEQHAGWLDASGNALMSFAVPGEPRAGHPVAVRVVLDEPNEPDRAQGTCEATFSLR